MRWSFELSRIINTYRHGEIPSGAIVSLGCRRGPRRETRKREVQGSTVENVTATNDVSANLTLRQIDLSRNPIVACFPEPFPFCQKSDQISFYESEHLGMLAYSTFRSIAFPLIKDAVLTYYHSPKGCRRIE